MERTKQNRKRSANRNGQKNNTKKTGKHPAKQKQESGKRSFHYVAHENIEALRRKEKAIKEFKGREVICSYCSQPIADVASSIADKTTGNPVHFDCIMKQLSESESLGENEKISYIGQGRFAILFFENPRDQRRFSIRKLIEWEGREQKIEWRAEISSLYSQVD